jgi:CBS domain-containing protein
MKAADIMTTRVVTAPPEAAIGTIAALMCEHGISAVPIVDPLGRVVGMVSEGDLLRRDETGTARHRSWWLRTLADPDTLADEYAKTHGRTAADVMTRSVVSVTEDTPIADIVDLLERHRIKRVPVVRNGFLVGIVSRANLVRALAVTAPPSPEVAAEDGAIQAQLKDELARAGFASLGDLDIIVSEGTVHLWGTYASDSERNAIRIAAEGIPGVRAVADHLNPRPVVIYQA